MSYALAMLSVHTSPLVLPGSAKDAGGMNVYIRELALELSRSQCSVDIFTRRTQPDQPEIVALAPRVRVIHITAGPAAPVEKHQLSQHLPAFARQVAAFARREQQRYALLHSHYWLSGAVALELADRWHVPHLTMFHTLAYLKHLANPQQAEPEVRLSMERRLIQRADRIIATTHDERLQMIRHCGALPHRVQVIPCGVDLGRFVPHDISQARTRLGLKVDRPMLLFVGRLDPFKGPDVFLQAAALMHKKAQLVVVGGKTTGDPELEQLRHLARQPGLAGRVHFLGARPQQELPLIYSAADVTVVPSYHESFGMAAVESLACATPVVATRAGGLITIVRCGQTGYLVPRSPGFFAERLDSLLAAPDTLQQMRAAARPSILHYSWQSVARSMVEVYADMLDEAAERAGARVAQV
jgi:D-inositol-3-phosphate glycosyltransferase